MKILVTGAAGFIGSQMAEKLAANHEVLGIDNLSDYYSKKLKQHNIASLKNNNIEFIEADLRDIHSYNKLSKNIGYIFHFAAQPGLSATSTFHDYFSNNVIATYNLIEFARQCKQLKMFVNISTSSVYGIDATKDENAVPQPASYYGVTKLAAEQLVLSESRNNKFNACSLRLYSVYGPRERPDKLYTKLIDAALNNKPFTLIEGSLQHKRSFSFVGDIIEGIGKVFGKEQLLNKEIINIGTDVQHTTQYGIETVEKLIGKKIEFKIIPVRSGDQSNTKAVIDKAKKLLNYSAETNLKSGLEKQLNWFKGKYL